MGGLTGDKEVRERKVKCRREMKRISTDSDTQARQRARQRAR